MNNILASFVIPAYNRERTIDRCIRSVVAGGMTTDRYAYEIVAVNDASTDGTKDKLTKWSKKLPYNLTLLNFIDHSERIMAFNAGMLQAQGDWIIMLDSDDEIASHFKETFEQAIEMYPTAMVFNWGSLRHWRNKDGRYYRTDVLKPFKTVIGKNGKVEPFKSGGIASGAFAFKKGCLNVTGYFPEAKNPFEFGKQMLGRYEELKKLYTLPDGRIQYDLGNPWGNDAAMYFMLTRHWNPVTLDQILHYIHVRQ